MNLTECLQRAIDAGDLDPDLGRQAQAKFEARVKEHVGRGLPEPAARIAAADDVAEGIIRGIKGRRHATLHQLRILNQNQSRYARAALDDPDLILKDIEWVRSEQLAIEQQLMSGIHDFLAAHKTNVFGKVRQVALLKDVTRELHGQASGNVNAKMIAESVLHQYERVRSMANALGMDIGKLDDWGIKHTHHARKIEQAGYAKWYEKLYDGRALDWSRIVDHDTGKPFVVAVGARPLRADADRFLKPIFDSIVTRQWNDRAPSMVIAGKALSNTRSESRILHFRDADAWMEYNDAFGTENPFEAVISHFRGMARDIALMRNFGPNPKMGLTHALQVIEKTASTDASLTGKAVTKMRNVNARKAKKAAVMMRMITGENNVPASTFWASFLAGTRNLLTAAQLGGAPLSTVTDWVSMRVAAKAVSLNQNKHTQAQIGMLVKGMSPQQAKDMGFIFDTWFDTGASQARFMGDIWAPELTSRITNTVLRLNGLAFLTDRARVAVSAAFGSDLADLAGKAWADLPPNLINFMQTRRITPADWNALRDPRAIYTDPTGGKHVNPDWFRHHTDLPSEQAEDIAIRWAAMVMDHREMAIPTASLRGRATILGDAPPGTFPGELLRSSMMYKSYSLSVMFNQMRRIAELDGGPATKGLYVAKYIAFMTIAGAMAIQMKEQAKGRDPRPMDTREFWQAALLQGGGVGIFGDFFSANTSRAGGGLAETLSGPVVGIAGDVARAYMSNAARAADGKDMLIGRDVANMARRYNPLATFQPPIPVPTRLAMDRLIWDQLQLALDPEAEAEWRKAEKKLKREYGTQSFWRKGQLAPDRGPDLGNALPP